MISSFQIENFRGIKKINLETPKITVLTGANNSGKSSIIYAMLVLKNIINNTNQSLDSFFNLPFINLGGFKETVFQKDEDLNIKLGVKTVFEDIEVFYGTVLNPMGSKFIIRDNEFQYNNNDTIDVDVFFPYPLNRGRGITLDFFAEKIEVSWNGIQLSEVEKKEGYNNISSNLVRKIENTFVLPIFDIQNIDFVPIRRGFTQSYFNPVPLQTQITTEDEIATLLSIDRDLAGKVAHYLEKIVDRSFSVHPIKGIASFYLQTRNPQTGFTADLVNEGLGTNQLVTILAKALQKNNAFICIDEPEIHLHPSLITRLVEVLVNIAQKECKQFVVSTHSEHFIMGLLKEVVKENIQHDEIAVYHLTTDKYGTNIERQAINDKGQIEGGLVHFIASEIDDLATLFKL